MKNGRKYFGAALIALAVLAVPALAAHINIGTVMLLSMSLGLVGAVTVTYKFPVSSTTTAPTAVQSSQTQVVTGTVNWLESDTIARFTHNLGIATAVGFAGSKPTIAQGFPDVHVLPVGADTVAPVMSFVFTDGNVVTINKGSIAGTGGTLLVAVYRPQSIGVGESS